MGFYDDLSDDFSGEMPGEERIDSRNIWRLAYKLVKAKRTVRSNGLVSSIQSAISGLGYRYYTDEITEWRSLIKLAERYERSERERLLENKVIIGVGGQFSAGKSCFLNSITGVDFLPEDNRPTTSIETYITKGGNDKINAYMKNGAVVELEKGQMHMLSHNMARTYNFSLSNIIASIGLETSALLYENIALLDTPGYTKADSSGNHFSDKQRAVKMLSNVDYLIWLIDAENGVITETDINFISSLQVAKKILFVVNKADKKADIDSIVEKVKETIIQSNLPCYAVIPYSSFHPDEYGGEEVVREFLTQCDKEGEQENGLYSKIVDTWETVTEMIRLRSYAMSREVAQIYGIISNTDVMPGNNFLACLYFEKEKYGKVISSDLKKILSLNSEICDKNAKKQKRKIKFKGR